jgi:hypothetical protein
MSRFRLLFDCPDRRASMPDHHQQPAATPCGRFNSHSIRLSQARADVPGGTAALFRDHFLVFRAASQAPPAPPHVREVYVFGRASEVLNSFFQGCIYGMQRSRWKRILKAKTMSRTDTLVSAQTQAAAATQSPVSNFTFAALFTAAGAIVLIASEIWLAALATIWAADGVLGLSTTGDVILSAVVVPLAIWATWMTAKLAINAEMDPDNAG